jgi:PAS domain S-box-containing protein
VSATDDAISVLHVDDEPGFAEMAGEFVEREGPFRVETARSAGDALDRLADDGIDCVVSDYDMPGRDGLDLLRTVREEWGDLPFVLFTGKGSEEVASEAISAGVSDYLQKGTGTEQYTLLANRLENVVERRRAEANYRETFENAADGIIVHDAETGAMVDANERVAEMLGYEREELLSMSVGEFSAEGFTDERAARHLQRAVEEGEQTFEWLNETADGEEQWSEIHLATAVLDGKERILASIRDISERKARERELRETNRQLQGVLDTVEAAIFVKDPEGHYLLMNERTRELTGLDPDTGVAGVTDAELFPEAVAERFRADDRRVVETGETIEVEEEVPAGEETETMLTRKSPVYDEDGDLYAVCAVATEITDRKQRERELDFFRRLVESVGVGVAVYGADGRFRYVNPAYADLFDADPAALEGVAVWDVNPEFDRESFDAYWDSFEEGETRGSETLHAVGDAEVPVETVTTRQTIQGTPYNFGTIRDVTARRERERELEARSTAMEAAVDGIAILDGDGRYRFVNRAHAEVYGYETPAAFVGESWRMCYDETEAERLADEAMATLFDDGEWRGEGVGRRADGTEFDQELSLTLTENDDIICVVRDVTERKARERELEARNERLDRFASLVSHDLRNPLNVASGRLDLARQDSDGEHLATVAEAHRRMESLIDDLLTLSRDGTVPTDTEPIDLAPTLERCWQSVGTRDAALAIETEATVVAESGRLKRLLENLLRNAVEHGTSRAVSATADGGVGEVSSRDGDDDDDGPSVTVTVGDTEDGFYVADDGPGIPEAERERVFESGYSTRADGTGFGLRIVEQVAETHGWTVALAESADGGARFDIAGVECP